ncbi:MAG TPA: isoprenylcysteine carboxylmethyltransferase family protein [Ignavibacteria bacterium]|jgi:methyltransferase
MFFWIFLFFVILQRLAELVYAKHNERHMISRGAIEYDREGYKYIVIMHSAFFISLIVENFFLLRELNPYWYVFFIIFVCGQGLRYSAIISLKEQWNTKIIVLKSGEIVKTGPYRYLRHPNYLGVVLEIIAIPLMFSCYITAFVFTILNLLVLKRRIPIEGEALRFLNSSNGNKNRAY